MAGPRVLILTADVGEGHVAAARALAAEIVDCDPDAEPLIADALQGLGRTLRVILLDLYRWQLTTVPAAFALLYGLFANAPSLRSLGRRTLFLLGGRSLRRLVELHRPDIVVSTYPAATAVLGELRRRGAIDVPLYATVTDLAGEAFWAHPAVDRHLVMHETSRRGVEKVAGAGSACVVRPLVHPRFYAPLSRADARDLLGLDQDEMVVLVSGGGWGVGDLGGAARAVLEVEGARAICLTGRNTSTRAELERAFATEPRVTVLGFTESMSELLAAADAVVHSTGGVTCLEAFVRACPVIAYGEPGGHAPGLARKMAALGLVERARNKTELESALQRVRDLGGTPVALETTTAASSVVLSGERRPPSRRPLRRRVAILLPAAASALVVAWMATSNNAYAFLAPWLDIAPTTSLGVRAREVALVVRASPDVIPAVDRVLARRHAHASLAVTGSPSARPGAEPTVPLLPSEIAEPLGFVEELAASAKGHPRYGLEPAAGLSLSAYLSAWEAGWHPIGGRRATEPLRPGTIAVLSASPDPARAAREVDGFLARARAGHLRVIALPASLVASNR